MGAENDIRAIVGQLVLLNLHGTANRLQSVEN